MVEQASVKNKDFDAAHCNSVDKKASTDSKAFKKTSSRGNNVDQKSKGLPKLLKE